VETARCATEAPTLDSPFEFSRSRLGKFLLSFVTDVTCALALAVSVPVSEECEDEAVLCSQSASSVRAGKLFDRSGDYGAADGGSKPSLVQDDIHR